MRDKLPPSLRNALRRKRLVFTVTTGRSGTAYLTTLFRYLPGVDANHEPEPQYSLVFREVQQSQNQALSFLLEKKLPAIAERPSRIYVETSHLFCKGFLEPLLKLEIVPDLVIHSRPHREVATSMYRMGTIPGRTEKGMQFYLSPDDPDVLPLMGWKSLHDYQLCYWYCLEMERRGRKYERMYQSFGAKAIRTTLDGVRSPSGFMEMVELLGLPKPGVFNRLRQFRNSRFKINEARMKKKASDLPHRLEEMEREVREKIER